MSLSCLLYKSVFIWLRGFFSPFTLITDGAMKADVLDYQQYKTGERLEGLMSQFVGIIGTFVSMGCLLYTSIYCCLSQKSSFGF